MFKKGLSILLSLMIVVSVFTVLPSEISAQEIDTADTSDSGDVTYNMFSAQVYSNTFDFSANSMARSFYDTFSSSASFMNELAIWETAHVVASPSYSLKSGQVNMKDYYKTVLFDLLGQADSQDGLSVLLSNANNKYLSYYVNTCKKVAKAEDLYQTLDDGSLKYDFSKISVQDAITLTEETDLYTALDITSTGLKILGWAKDAKEVFDTFAKYQAVADLKNGTQAILTTIANDTRNPLELRDAARECIGYFGEGYDKLLNQIAMGLKAVGSFTFDLVADVALDWAWGLIVASIAAADGTPIGASILAGLKGGRLLSNLIFDTDKEIEAFYKLRAVVAFEDAANRVVSKYSSGNFSVSDADATLYLEAVSFYQKAVILGFDYSIDFCEIAGNSSYNIITDFLFGKYSESVALINEMETKKKSKLNFYNTYENLVFNKYKQLYLGDTDSLLNNTGYILTQINTFELTQSQSIRVGDAGYINDYINVSYSPADYTEIFNLQWSSSNDSVIKFNVDYYGDSLGDFECLSQGTCTITAKIDDARTASIIVVVGEASGQDTHDYSGDFTYSVSNGSVTITKYKGTQQRVLIPSVINGYAVTVIGREAFSEYDNSNHKITRVAIPDSITSIGYRAFYGCDSLESVTIGNSVSSIGSSAFYGCTNLTSIVIPVSVTSIDSYAFYQCDSLTSITVPDSVTSIGNYAFSGCDNLKQVDTGDGVSSLNGFSFMNNTVLESVIIGNSVTSIDHRMFENCSSLYSANIGNSVINIGSRAFWGCSSLNNVTMGNSITTLGANSFENCTNLESITIPDSVTRIGLRSFSGCIKLKSITIPDSVTSIGSEAFNGCTSLTSVSLGNSITNIYDEAFYGCTSLNCVNIHDIDAYCRIDFENSYGYSNPLEYAHNLYLNGQLVTELIIPDSVTSISNYAFEGCTSITSVIIPESITSIGYRAFSGCDNLDRVIISEIYAWNRIAFEDLHSNPLIYAHNLYLNEQLITELLIPDSITSISDYAFEGCTSITSVILPESITCIGDNAFKRCAGLTSIELPDSVTSIGSSAFFGCESLTGITIPDSVTSIGNSAFSSCTNLSSIEIPDSVTSIGNSAFSSCTNLSSIEIPNSVTSIDEKSFYNCKNLTSVIIPSSVTLIGRYSFGYHEVRYGNTTEIRKVDNFTIYGYKNTEAEKYANENRFIFSSLDEEPTERPTEMATALPTEAPIQNMQIKVVADKTEVTVGDIVNFSVILGPVANVGFIQMQLDIPECLTYVSDSGKLEVNASTLGFDDFDWAEWSLMINGYAYKNDYASSIDTVLASFQCRVNNNAGGALSVGLKDFEIGSSETLKTFTELFSIVKADLFVEGTAPTVMPTQASTQIPTQAPTQTSTQVPTIVPTEPIAINILGDVDGDSEVTIIDATFIQRYLASLAIPFEMNEATADTDGDGEITIIDATFIQRYLASLAVPYDIGNPINK